MNFNDCTRQEAQQRGEVCGSQAAIALHSTTGFSFGKALELLKDGNAVRRAGWNGKGMLICLEKGSSDFREDLPIPVQIDGVPRRLFNKGDRGTVTRLPHIAMRTASGSTVNGWLASQADMLAEDWVLV